MERSYFLPRCARFRSGGYEYGPADAEPYLETYSWLDIYGEGIFESGDTLAAKLQKYSDLAVYARENN